MAVTDFPLTDFTKWLTGRVQNSSRRAYIAALRALLRELPDADEVTYADLVEAFGSINLSMYSQARTVWGHFGTYCAEKGLLVPMLEKGPVGRPRQWNYPPPEIGVLILWILRTFSSTRAGLNPRRISQTLWGSVDFHPHGVNVVHDRTIMRRRAIADTAVVSTWFEGTEFVTLFTMLRTWAVGGLTDPEAIAVLPLLPCEPGGTVAAPQWMIERLVSRAIVTVQNFPELDHLGLMPLANELANSPCV